jgi:hypothetical protein
MFSRPNDTVRWIVVSARTLLVVVVLLVGYRWLGSTFFFIGLAVFVLYEMLWPPSRYRRFGPGQTQEAMDNRFGIFGRSYREDEPDREPHRIGRNDPCPCGSGKKYKRCHLTQDETSDA